MHLPYLHQPYDWRSAALSDAFDDAPLWSAMPGQLLLENLPFAGQQALLDIGCGTGFPLLNLARRFGPQVQVFGVDNWHHAMARAARKCEAWGLRNVTFLESDARQIALPDQSIDLITSNLGLNNFEAAAEVLQECRRLLRPGGRLCLATNLAGTFAEFYAAWEAVADPALQAKVQAEAARRYSVEGLQYFMAEQGFEAEQIRTDAYTMTYADGTAFLNDCFIGMAFLPSWIALVAASELETEFSKLETEMNARAKKAGKWVLTVPIAYLQLRLA
jgi:ubiquinone/menaquinone biosynthesis C-methylase UbiE